MHSSKVPSSKDLQVPDKVLFSNSTNSFGRVTSKPQPHKLHDLSPAYTGFEVGTLTTGDEVGFKDPAIVSGDTLQVAERSTRSVMSTSVLFPVPGTCTRNISCSPALQLYYLEHVHRSLMTLPSSRFWLIVCEVVIEELLQDFVFVHSSTQKRIRMIF